MASMKFKNVFIKDYYTLVCDNENLINPKLKFDIVLDDYYNSCKTLEQSEIKMQNQVLEYLIKKNVVSEKNIDLIVGGELSNQLATSNYNLQNFNIPFLGVYSACATFIESMIIISNLIENNFIKNGIAITSSHNLNSEKQFRFPIEYGAYKPRRTTITITGSTSALLGNTGKIKVESATIGKVINSSIKDVFEMGGVMAVSAYDTICNHLKELNREINYYDLVLTGDLGKSGENIIKDLFLQNNNIKLKNYMDAGANIYDKNLEEAKSGASGPTVIPLYLFSKVLKMKKYKKILVVGTGSLHTPVMVNQKNTIPSISHAISLEVIK